MSKDNDAFSKLKEIEKELESLNSYKEEKKEPSPNFDPRVLNSINKSCVKIEKKVGEISDNLRTLVRLFHAAMKGESADKVENNEMLDRIDKLVEQNSELIARLDGMSQDLKNTNDYNSFKENSQARGRKKY